MFLRIAILLILFVRPNLALGFYNTPQLSTSSQIALPIGVKIWFNESGGSIKGLTAWNEGENFASLGIGHFTWYPYSGRRNNRSSFPYLIRYMEKRGAAIPFWIQGNGAAYCPWSSRNEFLRAQYSPQMLELRRFLQQTIPLQAEYITQSLTASLPDLLASAPPRDRPMIYQNFCSLAHTPAGVYALVDYLNFKGAGISNSPRYYENGSGLLQVLKGMQYAPRGSTPLQAYVWSAKNALIRRVEHASASSHDERWLSGWFKRLNTYLEGDLISRPIIR